MRDETPLIWPVFQRAMETLIALRGPDLLRIKGLLNLAGSKGPVVFQAVQHLIHPPVELAAWPDRDHASRVVFITRGVQRAAGRATCSRRAGRWGLRAIAAESSVITGLTGDPAFAQNMDRRSIRHDA